MRGIWGFVFLVLMPFGALAQGVGLDFYNASKFQEAQKPLIAECSADKKQSCEALGDLYFYGDLGQSDYEQAKKYLTLACNANLPSACNNLGLIFQNGYGVTSDIKTAAELFKKSCDLNVKYDSVKGCENLALVYRSGFFGEEEKPKEALYTQKSCDLLGGDGCSEIGLMYKDGRIFAQDIEKSGQYMKRACELKSVAGCGNLGLFLYSKQDFANSLKASDFACQYGVAISCLYAGVIEEDGKAGKQDYQGALNIIQLAVTAKIMKHVTIYHFCIKRALAHKLIMRMLFIMRKKPVKMVQVMGV